MRKNSLLFIALFVLFLSSSAQTQQGYVKTPGRRVNGQTVPGKRLNGVTVQVKGRNAVVSKADGTFSFPVPSNKFSIQSVKKQGYTLIDPEAIAIQYTYSPNPLILVMETPQKLNEDRLAVEQNLRQNLHDELKDKEGELINLKDQNQITIEEYQAALSKLQNDFTSKDLAIESMANYYSRIDYDQLDEYNINFSDCILNGRLNEAYDLWCSRDDFHDHLFNQGKPLVGHDSETVLVASSNEADSKTRPTSKSKPTSENKSAIKRTVTFNCNVKDVPAYISIDGKPAANIDDVYMLPTGNHKVLITADGYEPLNSSIEVVEEGDFFYFKLKKTRVEVDSIESHN